MDVQAAEPTDRTLVERMLTASWGGTIVVAHGVRYDAAALPALIAWQGAEPVGLLTYTIGADGLEVVTIDAVTRGAGAGSALLAAATAAAWAHGCARVWLITTNDNLDALRFYQRRGMRIVAVTPGAVDHARRIKPEIPLTGAYGIGLHDELTLEVKSTEA
ncbi:MAG: GNAT family N-acetyltransferase [Actinoplanes sp.]